MCGICGIVHFNNQQVEEQSVRVMMNKLKHRGPDDEGVFIKGNVAFGFVRLSILDLSKAGNQPMLDETGRYTIIHNGEVYNYIELRKELQHNGFTFNSGTDTEVILKSYIFWGENCLERFNGMWAFAIFDNVENTLFISRDRYGIKPLYYYLDKGFFLFSSEIPPIVSALQIPSYNIKPSPDYQSIFDYLVFNRTDQSEKTFFSNIVKLQGGSNINIDTKIRDESRIINPVKNSNWYNLKDKVAASHGFIDSDEYRSTFSKAVGLRLRSDVPVGVCLSGGLDSSSIASSLIRDHNKNDLNSFSAVYGSGKTGDESQYIKEFSPFLKNMFYTTPSADSLFTDMNQFVSAHAEPVPSTSPYAQFKVMELAKDHVTVTLDGQGADEELAGYHYFYGFYFKELIQRIKIARLLSEIYYYLSLHKSIYGLKALGYFLLPQKLKLQARIREKKYLMKDFLQSYKAGDQVTGTIYGSESLNHALLDHFEHKLEHLLKWEDRNSMWFSLEARVPFLDHNLVEKTLSLSPEMIIKKGINKSILRKAMEDILPIKIRQRKDKIGFGTPADEWFRTEKFKKFIVELIHEGYFFNSNIINKDQALGQFNAHLRAKINIHKEIWKWINLELWYQTFINS